MIRKVERLVKQRMSVELSVPVFVPVIHSGLKSRTKTKIYLFEVVKSHL